MPCSGDYIALKQVHHPQVGENRTALFPVPVLFWRVGRRGVMSVTYSMSGRDGWRENREGERNEKDKYRVQSYLCMRSFGFPQLPFTDKLVKQFAVKLDVLFGLQFSVKYP